MVLHLGVAVGVEENGVFAREDVGDAVAVPEAFGAFLGGAEGGGGEEEGEGEAL